MSAPINLEYINNRSLQTRIVNLQYRLEGMPDFDSAHVIQVPLYPDSALHEYTYPIRLLEGDRRGILTGLRANIILQIPGSDETITYLPEIRLISNGEKGKCPSAVMPVNLALPSSSEP